MKAYDNYKESGVEWIGEIPEHWALTKLKFLGEAFGGLTYSPNDLVDNSNEGKLVLRSSNIQNGKLDLNDNVYVNLEISEKLTLRKGDILICSRNGSKHLIGKNICIDEQMEGNTFGAFMMIFRSKEWKFLYQYFNSPIFTSQSSLFLSSTINQLTSGTLKDFFIAVPNSEEEQTAIAAFLDYKTNLIDATIEKKKRLIELLKEKRQAVINEAATKGLNANAPMKDSGVEWLGEIPEHWEVKKLLHLSNIIDPQPDHRAPLMDEYGLPYLGIRDINKNGTINIETARIVELNAIEKQERAFTIKDGDIVFGKVGTLAEPKHILLGGERVALSATLVLIQTDEEITSRYLKYFLDSSFIWDQINTVIVGATRPALGIQQIRKFIIFFPPQNEVKQIVDYLDISTNRILDLIEKINYQIGNLQIYRQSLISEAVTGKIDVRDWQPPKK